MKGKDDFRASQSHLVRREQKDKGWGGGRGVRECEDRKKMWYGPTSTLCILHLL